MIDYNIINMSKKIGNVENVINAVVKKRGRKSKKEIEEAKQKSMQNNPIGIKDDENIVVKIEETEITEQMDTNLIDEIINSENDKSADAIASDNDKPFAKKRGRKPKGGKIVQQLFPLTNPKETKPNIILHLKCSLKDLNLSSNLFGSNLDSFSFSKPKNLDYDVINNENAINDYIHISTKLSDCDGDNEVSEYDMDVTKNKENDIRDIWKKLKVLEHNLHVNNIDNKKSACFWDTCEFDNPPVYIPKHFMNDTYHVYGCFCSPECAVAHLMEENIDSSIKFERYQLMNHIYSKVYNYNKNIKPAPNPYYMLEKYYGNLSIQEYRSLLQNERLFLVVDKPLTRVMPELHEDNDDFIINNKIIPTNNIKLRKLQRKQTKTTILSERFGLTQ